MSPAELAELYDELRKIQLSTYQYRGQPEDSPRRLGFIIDDTRAPAAIDASGDRVDVYGYVSMAVAAVQIQAREIDALKDRLTALQASCPGPKREGKAKKQ